MCSMLSTSPGRAAGVVADAGGAAAGVCGEGCGVEFSAMALLKAPARRVTVNKYVMSLFMMNHYRHSAETVNANLGWGRCGKTPAQCSQRSWLMGASSLGCWRFHQTR